MVTETGSSIRTLPRSGVEELFISATGTGGQSLAEVHEKAVVPAREAGAAVVAQRIFGGPAREVLEHRDAVPWPVICLSTGGETVSTQLHAVSSVDVHYADDGSAPQAAWFEDDAARYCTVAPACSRSGSPSRTRETETAFERMQKALSACGGNFDDIIRTWFYLDDILAWYDEFNDVRDAFFARCGVYDGVVPASTGIGMPNPCGAALTSEAIALQHTSTEVAVNTAASPKQCSPMQYGSSFSRALEAVLPDHRRLYVSGTASISADGHTLRQNDFTGQVDTTMSVVEKILDAQNMHWDDVTRATAYVRRPGDIPALQEAIGGHSLPLVVVPAVICRDNLLFELEVDAMSSTT